MEHAASIELISPEESLDKSGRLIVSLSSFGVGSWFTIGVSICLSCNAGAFSIDAPVLSSFFCFIGGDNGFDIAGDFEMVGVICDDFLLLPCEYQIKKIIKPKAINHLFFVKPNKAGCTADWTTSGFFIKPTDGAVGRDIGAFVGSGFGGRSLISASTSEQICLITSFACSRVTSKYSWPRLPLRSLCKISNTRCSAIPQSSVLHSKIHLNVPGVPVVASVFKSLARAAPDLRLQPILYHPSLNPALSNT